MKRFTTISTSVILMLLLFGSAQNKATAQEPEQVTYQTFYDELSPYGTWIDYPEYGYVWQPDMGADFRPYSTNGHWVWTDDYEWMWVSDYPWGWAPFHYGRWFYDDYYGWLWIPGYEWSPAWVCWRSGGDYYGWAPLGPQFSAGISFSFGRYSPPANYWCFVDRQYIASPYLYEHCYGVQRNAGFINNTTIINNYRRERNVFVTGPGRREVERYTHESIRPVAVRDAMRPGRTGFRNNEVAIYRPQVNRNNNRFAPERVQRFNRDQRNDVADNRGGWGRRMGNDNVRQQQDQMMRQRNMGAENNRRQFEQRQQQDQMMRQRNMSAENNRRQFEQRQQQDQMTRQRNMDAENNRRQFEQRQQQDQMIRQRNMEAENNRRQFEQRQQQDQMIRQRNMEAENNRRQFEQRQQQPQFERRNPEQMNRPGGFGGFRNQPQQQQQPQAQPQRGNGGGDRGDHGQGRGGWRHSG